jgi:hypothetical protein
MFEFNAMLKGKVVVRRVVFEVAGDYSLEASGEKAVVELKMNLAEI